MRKGSPLFDQAKTGLAPPQQQQQQQNPFDPSKNVSRGNWKGHADDDAGRSTDGADEAVRQKTRGAVRTPCSTRRFAITLVCAACAVLLVIALAAISRALERREADNRYPPALVDRFKSLVRFAAQRSAMSLQDQNPVVALLHANSALVHAQVARTLLPAADAQHIAEIDLDELILVLEEQQLDAMRQIHISCPRLQPNGVAAVATGWLA